MDVSGSMGWVREMTYEHWRAAMLEMCDKLPDRRCPFCDEVYDDIAEYVDAGVGGCGVQVTPNVCKNVERSSKAHTITIPKILNSLVVGCALNTRCQTANRIGRMAAHQKIFSTS